MNQEIERYFAFLASQFTEGTPPAEIEAKVREMAVKQIVSNDEANELITKFQAVALERTTPQPVTPRLLVDWGDNPCVGHQVRPEFSLLCPSHCSRPEISIEIDSDLDHDATDIRRRPREEEAGLWTFHVPFRMTTAGTDCRPGHYLIDVAISFRDVPPDLPRFYRCRIRLHVPDQSGGDKGVLEIDGDGQSIVNLQGHNLKQFSKVILKGQGAGVINLHQSHVTNEAEASEVQTDVQKTTFEYVLKVDGEKQSRLPSVFKGVSGRAYLHKAGLYFDDGRRTLLLTSEQVTFGRNRENDVSLRFLPRSDTNDDFSRAISRTHFRVELTSDGVELIDESRSGFELNYSVVRNRAVLSHNYIGDVTRLNVGVTATVPQQLLLELLMLGPDGRETSVDLQFWDELYCEVIGGKLPRVWRQALETRVNAVRFDRLDNVVDETYVLLYREALIGGSRTQSAVVLSHGGPASQARLLHIDRSFWLEALISDVPVTVDGAELPVRTLMPLSPGMQIQIGTESAKFDIYRQSYLD